MKNSYNANNVRTFSKVNAVGKPTHTGLAHGPGYESEMFGLLADAVQNGIYFGIKFSAETRAFSLIPLNRFIEFDPRCGFEADYSAHFQPNRCLTSARTCSQGIPFSGCFRNSSALRSSSASISGVSPNGSAPSSDQICSAMSSCSLRGSALTCSR